MFSIIIDSLDKQNSCPKCGASWKELQDSLNGPANENWYNAMIIVQNCDVCAIRFKEVLNEK